MSTLEWALSSVWQSSGLLIRRSRVRIPEGPPTNLQGRKARIGPVDRPRTFLASATIHLTPLGVRPHHGVAVQTIRSLRPTQLQIPLVRALDLFEAALSGRRQEPQDRVLVPGSASAPSSRISRRRSAARRRSTTSSSSRSPSLSSRSRRRDLRRSRAPKAASSASIVRLPRRAEASVGGWCSPSRACRRASLGGVQAVSPLTKDFADLVRSHRPGKIEPLAELAVERLQPDELLRLLDALCDDFQLERPP